MMYSVLAIWFVLHCTGATIILDCTYSIAEYTAVGSVYRCNSKIVRTGKTSNVVGVSQNHETGKTDQDVKALLVESQQVDSIPTDINLHFANLELMYFYDSPIKSFTKADLKSFLHLKYFRINQGKLLTINGDVFQHSSKLEYIDFDFNQITNVGPGIFQHTPKLTSAWFQSNLCINSYVSDNATTVVSIARELAHKCPPFVEMIEETIFAGDKFKTAVKMQAVALCAKSETRDRLEELEKKFEKLEKLFPNLYVSHQVFV